MTEIEDGLYHCKGTCGRRVRVRNGRIEQRDVFTSRHGLICNIELIDGSHCGGALVKMVAADA